MKLTTNFSLEEFTSIAWDSIPERGQKQLKALAEMLQMIRAKIGKPIMVNSGVRSLADYNRLKKAGYNPSKTSDHFFWNQPDGYDMAVGAVDITCSSFGKQQDFYNEVLKLKRSGAIDPGQLLFEKTNPMGVGWVHIANYPNDFLSAEQMKKRSNFSLYGCGYSVNNGKSWVELKSGQMLPKNV